MTEPSNEYETALLHHVAEMERAAGMIAAILQECGEYTGITKETQYGRIAVLLNEKEEDDVVKKAEKLLEEVEKEMGLRDKMREHALKYMLLVNLRQWERTERKNHAKDDQLTAMIDVIVKTVREVNEL